MLVAIELMTRFRHPNPGAASSLYGQSKKLFSQVFDQPLKSSERQLAFFYSELDPPISASSHKPRSLKQISNPHQHQPNAHWVFLWKIPSIHNRHSISG